MKTKKKSVMKYTHNANMKCASIFVERKNVKKMVR